ncbi:hypothetical protein [Dokdonella soli]|uniref:Uncharacterized protein n=1 Tax=Dokdonella soli TaxID=529810 RepID=A0ABN1IFI8_9GAMM
MRTLLCAALLAAAIATPARAGNLLDLTIIDRDTGTTLPTWADRGKLYVAGTPGHRYSVRLSNRSGGRLLAVLSVDGVNAVSGQTASPDQTGYVLAPFESTEISGWRKNLDEVAQFNFTALSDSYAARTGRPANVGVIGVAVFTERVPVWRYRDEIAREAPSPAPTPAPMDAEAQRAQAPAAAAGAARPMPAQPEAQQKALARSTERLGTGHGEREYAHVDTTSFERASRRPAETVAVWYDSYANLVAQGIIQRPIARGEPRPFPSEFVPDPPAH